MSDGGGITQQGSTTGGWSGPQPSYLPPVTTSSEPDWEALAQRHEREAGRRKLLRIGGAAAGVVLVGGIVAGAVALQPSSPTDRKPSVTAGSSPAGVIADGPSASAFNLTASPSAGPSATASTGQPGATPGGSTSGGPARLDDRSGRYPITLAGGLAPGRTDGHNGPTLTLHSNSGTYGQTDGPVLDTRRSFTVSAMVRNNAPKGGRAVVTQGSDSYYSFYLGRDDWGPHNQWVFKVQTAAGAQDSTTLQAFSNGPATTGRWTLLTGVYDASTKKIALYVDGRIAETKDVKGVWQAGGPLQIGRVRWKSTWTDYWDGAIADVQVWDQALSASRVAQLGSSAGASAGVPAYASWLMP